MASIDFGLEGLVITDRGEEVLATAQEIVRVLGIESEPDAQLR
ncbi:MAG: hypothetical protein ACREBS_11075 [Nitrososphaerales archaeon]